MIRKIAGVILAGGEATRMGGGDKGLSAIGDTTLLGLVATRLASQADHVILNANGDPERFASFGLDIVADPFPEPVGPLGGVLAGLRWAERQGSFTHIVTAAADTPFFPLDLARRLGNAAADIRGIVLARSLGRIHPVFGLWPLALADDLETYLAQGGKRRVTAYAGDRHLAALVDFPTEPDSDPFFNVNTPEDLRRARAMMQGETK
ncbi:molybdenum cofactor guanylyltransferase MobA [Nitratireductor pacificus]|uniref:Molybdenum cofactor guanylyltransferase n=1 Tax=Nitratireductor pacificus pht-3B TaxID=391937 RepID=K2N0X8_9HYPH|nr:molybdenum cofactor guanylyltransferase MobA [Nitratireductor pacificus]EKF17913.1 molybdopterin-guanine dinucleotide biosynthesis protein MobA [Nitratireductor pacificus pht-3B]